MDLLVGILELRLDDERGWVAEAAGGGVVGAGVAALGLNVWDVAVLRSLVWVEGSEVWSLQL